MRSSIQSHVPSIYSIVTVNISIHVYLPNDRESLLFYSTTSSRVNSPGRSDYEAHINEDNNMQLSDSNSSSTNSHSESENDESVEHSGHCDPSQMSKRLTPGDSRQYPSGEPSQVQPCDSLSCSSILRSSSQ